MAFLSACKMKRMVALGFVYGDLHWFKHYENDVMMIKAEQLKKMERESESVSEMTPSLCHHTICFDGSLCLPWELQTFHIFRIEYGLCTLHLVCLLNSVPLIYGSVCMAWFWSALH